MLLTEGVCTQVTEYDMFFTFFDSDADMTRHIRLARSKCACDSGLPATGDLVLLLADGVCHVGNIECVDILERRPTEARHTLEVSENLWTLHDKGHWIAITTNGVTKANGEAVMGKGCAKEAADRFRDLPIELGILLHCIGNVPHIFPDYHIITFPTKNHWQDKSIPKLILQSYQTIVSEDSRLDWQFNDDGRPDNLLFIPRPGCGNGGLNWPDVRALLLPYWNPSVIVATG